MRRIDYRRRHTRTRAVAPDTQVGLLGEEKSGGAWTPIEKDGRKTVKVMTNQEIHLRSRLAIYLFR